MGRRALVHPWHTVWNVGTTSYDLGHNIADFHGLLCVCSLYAHLSWVGHIFCVPSTEESQLAFKAFLTFFNSLFPLMCKRKSQPIMYYLAINSNMFNFKNYVLFL